MALTGSSIASTYLKLLRANSDTMGADDTASYIQDSADTDSALSISTTRVGIGTDSPSKQFQVEGSSGGVISINTSASASSGYCGRLVFGNDGTDDVLADINAIQDGATDAAKLQFRTEATGEGISTRMTIKSTGLIGIGTAAPAALLHLDANTAYTDGIMLSNSGSVTTGLSVWYDNSNNISYIDGRWDHANDIMKFRMKANGTPVEVMTFDSAGNVGIGNSTPLGPLDVQSDGAGWYVSPNAHNSINRGGADTEDLDLWINYHGYNDGATRRRDLRVGNGMEGVIAFFDSSSGDVTVSTGNLVIGANGKGIDFSANTSDAGGMTAEILDDYEEGTWNAVVKAGGTSLGAITTETCRYTKIGNRVFFSGWINEITKNSETGAISIDGLPFTIATAANGGYAAVSHWAYDGISFANMLTVRTDANSTTLLLQETTEGGVGGSLTDAEIANNINLMVSGHYIAA